MDHFINPRDHIINSQYQISKTILDTQSIKIYECITQDKDESSYFHVHAIAYRPLIKYYLEHLEHLSKTLPFETSFVAGGDLYLVFRIMPVGLPIDHRSFSAAEKKTFLLSLIAKLALDDHLPNFIKWSMINRDCLYIDNNQQLHLNVYLDMLNPSSFSDFKSIQSRLADFTEALFEEEDEDLPLRNFILTCKKGNYINYVELLADYKQLMSEKIEKEEPWFYTKLYNIYLWLKQYQKRLIITGIAALVLYVAYTNTYGSRASTEQAFIKTNIGNVTYDDPYSQKIESGKAIVISAPVVQPAPVKPSVPKQTEKKTTPAPPKEPEYKIYVTKKGEYLVKICKTQYGDGKYAWVLARYNGLKDPSYLKVAFPLKLPTKAKIEALYLESRKK